MRNTEYTAYVRVKMEGQEDAVRLYLSISAEDEKDAKAQAIEQISKITSGTIEDVTIREVEKPSTFWDLSQSAKDELESRIKGMTQEERNEYFENDEPHEDIHDIADSNTPIYTSEVFEVAASDSKCWDIDDPGLTEGADGIVQTLQIHICEALSQELWDKYNDLKSEWEDLPECDQCSNRHEADIEEEIKDKEGRELTYNFCSAKCQAEWHEYDKENAKA